jgi:hypothetical protein
MKRLVLSTGLWQHAKMSTTLKSPNGLKDVECKKGQLSNQPPAPYVPVMDLVTTKEEPQLLKFKLPDDTCLNMPIFSCGNTEEYLAHIVAVLHIIKQKGWTQGAGYSERLLGSCPRHWRISWRLLGQRKWSCWTITWRPTSWRSWRPRRCSKNPRSSTTRQLPRHTSNQGTSSLVICSLNGIAFAARCTSVTWGLE